MAPHPAAGGSRQALMLYNQSQWIVILETERLIYVLGVVTQDLEVSHMFVDELPGDPETKNHRRQVCSLHAISPCFVLSLHHDD
jgi:hypothetical protein